MKTYKSARGEVNVSTLLLILVIIALVIYFTRKGSDNTGSSSTNASQPVQAQTEPQKPPPPKPEPAPPIPQSPDPLALLKEHIRYYQAHDKPLPGEALVDLKYDVQKTSSLVSPYVAYVSVIYRRPGAVVMDREEVITLALQEGRWSVTDARMRILSHYRPEAGGDTTTSPWQSNPYLADIGKKFGL